MPSDSVPIKQGKKMDSNVLHIEGLFYLEKGIYQLFFSEEKISTIYQGFFEGKIFKGKQVHW